MVLLHCYIFAAGFTDGGAEEGEAAVSKPLLDGVDAPEEKKVNREAKVCVQFFFSCIDVFQDRSIFWFHCLFRIKSFSPFLLSIAIDLATVARRSELHRRWQLILRFEARQL